MKKARAAAGPKFDIEAAFRPPPKDLRLEYVISAAVVAVVIGFIASTIRWRESRKL